MKIMINSDIIAVTLQKICKACSRRQGKLSGAPIPIMRER